MRKIYLLTSIAALGAAATQCGTPADVPSASGGSVSSSGGASSGGDSTSGGATSGGATITSGGATSGGATVTSGGATSGGSLTSGGAAGSAGTTTSGGAGSNAGGASGSAGTLGGVGGGASGEAGKAGGGAGGMAGGTAGGGAAGSAGTGGTAGTAGGGAAGSAGSSGSGGTGGAAAVTFADVAKILNANCGMFCHKAGNDKGHIVLSNTDNMLYTRLTTALGGTMECKGAILANTTDTSKSLLPLIVAGNVNTLGCDNVGRMPYMCSTTSGTPGGNPPSCLSKADITTIEQWVAQGAKGP